VNALPLLALCLSLLAGCAMKPPPRLEAVARGEGTLIVLNKSEDSVALLDALTGDRLIELPTGHAPHEVAVSPDGCTAVVSNYGDQMEPGHTLTVIDVPSSRVTATIDLGEHRRPHGLAFRRDGQQLVVTAEGSGSVLLVDVPSRRVLRAVATHEDVSHMVVLTPDDRQAWVSNIASGSVSVLDVERGTRLATIPTGAGAEGLDVSPDGREVWVGNRAEDTVSILDVATLQETAKLACPGFPIRLRFTPDGGRVLISCASTGDVAVFDAAGRREIARIPMQLSRLENTDGRLFRGEAFSESPLPIGLLIAPSGRRAWVANSNADIVTVVDLDSLQVAGRLKAGREPDGLACTPIVPNGL
jgi:YVTN family beta-propeller protein